MPGSKQLFKSRGTPGLWSFEARILLLCLCSSVLLWPLRGLVDEVPLVSFLCSMALFVAPGALLAHWFAGEQVSGVLLLPVAFVVSAGIFGLLGVPALVLGASIEVYLGISGLVLAAVLVVAVFRAFYGRPSVNGSVGTSQSLTSVVLWGLFVVLSAVLAFASRLRRPEVYEDIWVYTAWVREFAGADELALYEPYFGREIESLSRAKINGWLLEQAALSRISGLDPVDLVLNYLTPMLVVVALLAFYGLARVLLKNETAALFVGCVYALFFWAHLDFGVHSFGGEFIGRAAEDKLVARFAFLPVTLIFAALYLEYRKLRFLGFFALVVWAVVVIHPIGLAFIGLSVASFCLVYLVVHLREHRAWTGTAALGLVLASVVVPPAVLVLAGGSQAAALYSADINSGNPEILANMVFVRPEWRHIYELGNGYFIMHPFLILNPAIALSYIVGIPFLIFRLKNSLAAQMLFGIMVVTAVLVYIPPVATFFGNEVIIPSQIWRVAWPIPLAALITLGWVSWRITAFLANKLNGLGISERRTRLLPAVLVALLMVAAAPLAVSGVRVVEAASSPRTAVGYPQDPIFPWIRENLEEPGVMLAPDAENTVIPAYSSSVDVVSLRGGAILNNLSALERRAGKELEVPQRVLDVDKFYSNPTFDEAFEILRRYDVDYLLVYRGAPLEGQLEGLPEFRRISTPGERYGLFEVNLPRS